VSDPTFDMLVMPGGLAGKVIRALRQRPPGFEISDDDVATDFKVRPALVSSQLMPFTKTGWLMRHDSLVNRGKGGWRLGERGAALPLLEPPAAPAPPAFPSNPLKRPKVRIEPPDAAKLQVHVFSAVPAVHRYGERRARYAAALDRLKPGQCLQGLAPAWKSGFAAVIVTRHKDTKERYALRNVDGKLNVYRLDNAAAAKK
jgi:hypothetical protein